MESGLYCGWERNHGPFVLLGGMLCPSCSRESRSWPGRVRGIQTWEADLHTCPLAAPRRKTPILPWKHKSQRFTLQSWDEPSLKEHTLPFIERKTPIFKDVGKIMLYSCISNLWRIHMATWSDDLKSKGTQANLIKNVRSTNIFS